MYQIGNGDFVIRLADMATVPLDTGNRDYVAYLDWLAEGNEPLPAATLPAPDPLVAAKLERDEELASLVVTTASGLAFDGDEESQSRLARAVLAMEDGDTRFWVLADNSTAEVTREELLEALRLANAEQDAIWATPYTGARR